MDMLIINLLITLAFGGIGFILTLLIVCIPYDIKQSEERLKAYIDKLSEERR